MARFAFFVNGYIRAGDAADTKMYLSELLSDMHMLLLLNICLVEIFEINVSEIEE
jgi:hypothetical protein